MFSHTRYALWFPRVGFGLMLAGFGVNHYTHIVAFRDLVQSPFLAYPFLAQIAGLLAYLFPLLLIVGGASFATRQFCEIGKPCVLAALGGIIGWGGLGVLIGDLAAGGSLMPPIQNACIFLVTYSVIRKMDHCHGAQAALGGKKDVCGCCG